MGQRCDKKIKEFNGKQVQMGIENNQKNAVGAVYQYDLASSVINTESECWRARVEIGESPLQIGQRTLPLAAGQLAEGGAKSQTDAQL